MKITYTPNQDQDFHNAGSINLVIPAFEKDGFYILSSAQARRVENHFCGHTGCTCPSGGLKTIDYTKDGKEVFGIAIKNCK